MANSLLTINMITREAVRLWKNSNLFIQNIDTQYDSSFAQSGAKIGTSLRVRLPNDYTVRTGAAASTQDTTEQNLTLTVATQKGVDVVFNSVERTMSLDDYSTRVIAPAVNNLAGAVAADIMSGAEGNACNYVANVDGNNNCLSPTSNEFLLANALLDLNSAPQMDRYVVLDPYSDARTVQSLTGLFNPSSGVSQQYREGKMKNALGFDWFRDQTVIKHTTGTFSAGTVNGGSQTGSTLTVNAITGTLKKGDIITIAGVNAVNRITKVTTGTLRQFVVTSDVANAATSIPIYPAITAGNVAYATVDASPANSAAISLVHKASEVTRKNFAYYKGAISMVTADLEMPKAVAEAARVALDGISMRMVSQYSVSTDQTITRLDVLYGYIYTRPEWVVVVSDKI